MKYLLTFCLLIGLVACQSTMPGKDERMSVSGHLDEAVPQPAPEVNNIPPMVSQVPIVAPPKPQEKLQTFTVVATDLPARELLFALARDARLRFRPSQPA